MCGICGIVDFDGRPISERVVDEMRDMMVTRGPDDAGTQVLPHVGLGFRRLSIIDLSPRGHQPMTNEDGKIWLVFNGEIYNFTELRVELLEKGHSFASETDSEVLIHGYEEWGIQGLLERLNGMFGFAIWDAPKRELFLARDRLGKKPVYYGWCEGRFLFGSDVKCLWRYDPAAWEVERESVARYLYWLYLPGRETIYKDAFELLPGHYLRVAESGVEERAYWRLGFGTKFRGSAEDLLERTDECLDRAVRRRLRSDVPLGAFLSGGVDSSYVVSLMANANPQKVRTFAIGTDDPEHDERSHARLVAETLGTDHTEFTVTADAWSLLPRLVWAFGQPFADAAAIPTYYVSKCARQHVTVALTGDGGDESFAGYNYHRGFYLTRLLSRVTPRSLTELLLRQGQGLLDGARLGPLSSAARFVRFAHPDPLVQLGSPNNWTLHHLDRIWAPGSEGLVSPEVLLGYVSQVMEKFDGTNALDRALYHDLSVLLPFCYNVKVDVATMMNSLEARSPFQDKEVVEWAAQIDPLQKIRPWESKSLLKRAAARRVPREVVYRRKHGFSVPMDGWFLGPWAGAAHELILGRTARSRGLFDYDYLEQLWSQHQQGGARHGARFWAILWLELWHRMFIDRTLGPNDDLTS